MKPANLYIPQQVNEIADFLGMMMLLSPTFKDKTGRFPYRNLEIVFHQLNEGLRLIRSDLGDELYLKLIAMSDRMRAHFESDPENVTDDTIKGRDIIVNMRKLLNQTSRKSRG